MYRSEDCFCLYSLFAISTLSFMYTDIKLLPLPAPSFCPYTPAGPGSMTGGRASSVQTCCTDGPPISCGRRTF